MTAFNDDVVAHFESHHGIASRDQMIDAGLTPDDVKRLRRAGVIEQVLQGAYRLRGHPLTDLGRCAAVCIAHPGHVIAGPTAGRLWGLRRVPRSSLVHTISPPHSHPTRARWVRPYRTAAIDVERDVEHRPDGISVTSRPRTALDLTRWVESRLELLSIIEQVMSDGRHDADEMRAVAVQWRSPRRRWLDRYLGVLASVLPGRPAESHHEVVLGDALAAAGVEGLVRQHRIDLPRYGTAFFDLAVPALRWAIEIDVFPTHRETAGRVRDGRRDEASRSVGWTVSRVDESGFGDRLEATVERLLALHRSLLSDAAHR